MEMSYYIISLFYPRYRGDRTISYLLFRLNDFSTVTYSLYGSYFDLKSFGFHGIAFNIVVDDYAFNHIKGFTVSKSITFTERIIKFLSQ